WIVEADRTALATFTGLVIANDFYPSDHRVSAVGERDLGRYAVVGSTAHRGRRCPARSGGKAPHPRLPPSFLVRASYLSSDRQNVLRVRLKAAEGLDGYRVSRDLQVGCMQSLTSLQPDYGRIDGA